MRTHKRLYLERVASCGFSVLTDHFGPACQLVYDQDGKSGHRYNSQVDIGSAWVTPSPHRVKLDA